MDHGNPRRAWPLAPLAFVVGMVPLLAVHMALYASITQGFIEACNPYLQGCTSISRAGRHGLANNLFQAFMLPYAALLAAYWLACTAWLVRHGDSSGVLRWIPLLGVTAALFLVLYTTFLGTEGDFYRLLRRYGVIFYFAFNFLAQLLLTARMHVLSLGGRIATAKLALCLLVLLSGLANVAASMLLEVNDAFENIIEWNASLLMTAYFFLTWHIWRRERFSASFG